MAVSEMLETKIAQLYVGLIGRAPDRDGLEFWARGYNSDLDKGQNADAALRGVAQRMFDSDGARDYYPEGLSDQQIVEQFYENVLGRQGDAEGIAYWTDALAKSGTDTGDVLVSMIDAVTGYSGDDPAGVTSKQLFENKAAVADYYVDNVSQAGDAADIAGATALLDAITEDTDTASENAIQSFVSTNYEQAPAGEGLDVPFNIIRETPESDTTGYINSRFTSNIESEFGNISEELGVDIGVIKTGKPTAAWLHDSNLSDFIVKDYDTFGVDLDTTGSYQLKLTPEFSNVVDYFPEATLHDPDGQFHKFLVLQEQNEKSEAFDEGVYYSRQVELGPSSVEYLSLDMSSVVINGDRREGPEPYQIEIELVGSAQGASEDAVVG